MATVVGVVFQPGGEGVLVRSRRARAALGRARHLPDVARARVRPGGADRPPPARRGADRPAEAGACAAPARRTRSRCGANRLDAKRGMLLFRELAGRPRARAEADLGRAGVRPEPDRVLVLVRGAARHARAPDRSRRPAASAGSSCARWGRASRAGCAARSGCAARAACAAPATPATTSRSRCKMAKEQDLPMNPGRITGLCGRLRCCLAFEHPLYRSFRDRAPAVGRAVATPNGRGVVRSYEVLKDACVVELDGRTMVEITLDQMVEVAG